MMSRMSKLRTLVIVCCAFFAPQLIEAAPTVSLDITYASPGGTTLKLDLARPDDKKSYPAIVLIHGGSWRSGSKKDFRPFLTRLAESGYVVAAISYRLAPKFQWPCQLVDCRSAVRFLRTNAKKYGINPRRMGAVGFSAGAHLSLLLGSADDESFVSGKSAPEVSARVQAVVNFFGPVDIRSFRGRTISQFMGGTQAEKSDEYHEASPIVHLDEGDAPVLTMHGTKDALVPFKQAIALHKRLDELGVSNRFIPMKGEGHGWRGMKLFKSLQSTKKFLDKQLKVKAKLY